MFHVQEAQLGKRAKLSMAKVVDGEDEKGLLRAAKECNRIVAKCHRMNESSNCSSPPAATSPSWEKRLGFRRRKWLPTLAGCDQLARPSPSNHLSIQPYLSSVRDGSDGLAVDEGVLLV